MRRYDVPLAARSGQKIMQRRHHLGALAHRRSNTLHRTRADIADSEHALQAGFQRPGGAVGPVRTKNLNPDVMVMEAT